MVYSKPASGILHFLPVQACRGPQAKPHSLLFKITTFAEMPRILAIDYGTRRAGLAVTDPLQTIAGPLDTVHPKDLLQYLGNYLSREDVACFVVGDPKTLNNQPSSVAAETEIFVRELRKKFPSVPIERHDERFTSKIARQSLVAGGYKKKDRENKALLDMVSAVLILQSYMERMRHARE